MWAQSQEHLTIDRLEERSVERGSARRSSLKGRKWAIVNQTNIGTCFKSNVGETAERRDGAHMGFSEHTYHLELGCCAILAVLQRSSCSPETGTTLRRGSALCIFRPSLVKLRK